MGRTYRAFSAGNKLTVGGISGALRVAGLVSARSPGFTRCRGGFARCEGETLANLSGAWGLRVPLLLGQSQHDADRFLAF